METIRICPQCRKPLSAAAPEGLCPECLARVALESATAAKPSASPTQTLKIGPEAFARVRYFGDYELLEEIARGGMGVVWKARQTSLNRLVAVKMILSGKFAGEAEMQRFRREAEAAANLQHPNIVAIHEVGEHDGQHYYSMDYIAGRDLGALVRLSGPMPPAKAAKCLQTIAEAVHFAHQRGTLHRDLKPQNVLVDGAGIPRITDFGLAKFIEQDDGLTQSGAVMGSPSYMPPEQAAGHLDQIGPASDVYSLGAILYELLTGRPPFRGETPVATMRLVMESHPVAPRKVNPAIPPDLENICLKCLEKNPLRRYSSGRALAEDLGRFLKHDPIQARPASLFRKAENWLRQHPWTLVAAGSLAFMILACMFYWQFERVKFLEYQQLHANQPPPDFVSLAKKLENWWDFNFLVMFAAIYVLRLFNNFGRGVHWNKLLYPKPEQGPARPPSPSLCLICALLGVSGIAYTVLFAARIIEAGVWAHLGGFGYWLFVYLSFNSCLQLVSAVARDYQRFVYGAPARILSAEQAAWLREAILDGDLLAAKKLYRRAFPEFSAVEAGDFVEKLAAELKANEADKFVPLRKWYDLNWRAIKICLAIEAIALAIMWWNVPLYSEASWWTNLLGATIGFLFGVGGCLLLRLISFWARVAVMVLCLIPLLLMTWLMSNAADPVLFIYVEGAAFGAVLGIAGCFRRRRKYGVSKGVPTKIPAAH